MPVKPQAPGCKRQAWNGGTWSPCGMAMPPAKGEGERSAVARVPAGNLVFAHG